MLHQEREQLFAADLRGDAAPFILIFGCFARAVIADKGISAGFVLKVDADEMRRIVIGDDG